MKDRRFSLQPFSSEVPLNGLRITGSIARRFNTVGIHYMLLGPLEGLIIPSPAASPSRRNELWEETCFEFFIGMRNSDHYWEFNLSPSGDWNVYRFQAYRRGMQEEGAFATMPFRVERQTDSLMLGLELSLNKIVPAEASIEVGVSAVVKRRDLTSMYWALTHPGPQADFHRRDSFIIELKGLR